MNLEILFGRFQRTAGVLHSTYHAHPLNMRHLYTQEYVIIESLDYAGNIYRAFSKIESFGPSRVDKALFIRRYVCILQALNPQNCKENSPPQLGEI